MEAQYSILRPEPDYPTLALYNSLSGSHGDR